MNASYCIGELYILLNDKDIDNLDRKERLEGLIYIVQNNTYRPFWLWTTETEDGWVGKATSKRHYRAAFPREHLPLVKAGKMLHREGWQKEVNVRKIKIGKEGIIY